MIKKKLYKNNENKDDIYLCSIFSLTSDKTKTNDSLYEFIATSNKIFYNGDNKIQIFGILKNPNRNGYMFFIQKEIQDLSCSRMVDSISRLNEEYIGIG